MEKESFWNCPHRESGRSFSLLSQSRQADEAKIDPNTPSFSHVSSAEFQRRRHENLRIYAYANRIMNQLMDYMNGSSIAFALFDRDCCLLKLYGEKETLSALQADGIQKGTIWNFNEIGSNAVSIGMLEKQSLSSVGDENYCALLQKYAIYFSPIEWRNSFPPYQQLQLCGLALIVPAEEQRPHHLMFAFSACNSILLHLHNQKLVYSQYERLGYGLITIDFNVYNNKSIIFYNTENIFEILGIPFADICFRPLDELIDPEPENSDFWAIIKERSAVTNYSTTLCIQGKKIACIISTGPYGQPSLNVKGIQLIITTQKQMTAQVSEKMGNSAIRTFDDIVGKSNALRSAISRGRCLSNTDSNIMLLGESGVGKDIFAQALHNASLRSNKPFIAVNCGALPRDLIASELFGYESGAFTGAKRQGNIGKFELADGGTIFLDEIGELPLDIQATLLRVVEQKQFMRLGGNKLVDINVKIISATNANISSMISQNRFRMDLYYRLSTLHVNLPPLRERGEDIILLAEHFIRVVSSKIGRADIMHLSKETQKLLLTLPWPGNVRELQNLIESIVQLYSEPVIRPEHILENMANLESAIAGTPSLFPSPSPSLVKKREILTEPEISAALEACNGNRSEAARYLGIARKTLYRNMERLGM